MFGILYILNVFISCIIILTKKINLKNKAILVGVVFGLLGLIMTPRSGNFSDAVRFFNELDAFRREITLSGFSNTFYNMVHGNSSTAELSNVTLQYSSTPFMGLIMMIMSYLGNGWLLFITAFIDMASAAFLVMSSSEKYLEKNIGTNNSLYTWLIFTCLFNFNATIGGIRNGIVVFIFALSYWVIINKSSSNGISLIKLTLLAIVLLLIHPFALFIYLLAVLSIFFYRNKLIMFIAEIALLCQHFYQGLLLNNLGGLGNSAITSSITFKSTQYFGSSAYIVAPSNFSYMRDFIYLFIYVLCVILARHYSMGTTTFKKYNAFTNLSIAISIGACMDQIFFSRCIMLLGVVIIPYLPRLMYVFKQIKGKAFLGLIKFILPCILFLILMDNVRAGIRFFCITFNGMGN